MGTFVGGRSCGHDFVLGLPTTVFFIVLIIEAIPGVSLDFDYAYIWLAMYCLHLFALCDFNIIILLSTYVLFVLVRYPFCDSLLWYVSDMYYRVGCAPSSIMCYLVCVLVLCSYVALLTKQFTQSYAILCTWYLFDYDILDVLFDLVILLDTSWHHIMIFRIQHCNIVIL